MHLLGRLLHDAQIQAHVFGERVVERAMFVENLCHFFPLLYLAQFIYLTHFMVVEAVVLSPVWPCLELGAQLVFHKFLELVDTICTGQEWHLHTYINFMNASYIVAHIVLIGHTTKLKCL